MDSTPTEHIDALKVIIERHRGGVPAYVQFVIPERSRSIMPLPTEMNVAANDQLRLEVERLFGYNAATFE
jgi:DNA polymerase-3 subunit alpha